MGDDIEYLTSSLVIDRAGVTLDGNGYYIYFEIDTTNEQSLRHGVVVQADDVTVTDLLITNFSYSTSDWYGSYGIQVYNATNVTLNNLEVSYFNAGILVNVSDVKLTGNVDVTHNGFGGVEVSKGTEEGLLNSVLTLSGNIVNNFESNYSLISKMKMPSHS